MGVDRILGCWWRLGNSAVIEGIWVGGFWDCANFRDLADFGNGKFRGLGSF